MWIYLNESGNVTTMIPHGQAIRQGNRLDIWIARPLGCGDWTPMLSFLVPGSNRFQSGGALVPNDQQDEYVFHKLSSSETTYDLRDGKPYSVRHVVVSGEPPVATAVHGTVKMSISICEGGSLTRQSTCEFAVERTYGPNHERPVPTTEVEELRKMIDEYYRSMAELVREGSPESGSQGSSKGFAVHHVTITSDMAALSATLIADRSVSSPFTKQSDVTQFLTSAGLTGQDKANSASGVVLTPDGYNVSALGIFAYDEGLFVSGVMVYGSNFMKHSEEIDGATITDLVDIIG